MVVRLSGRDCGLKKFFLVVLLVLANDLSHQQVVSAFTIDVIWTRGHTSLDSLQKQLKDGVENFVVYITKEGSNVVVADDEGQSSNATLVQWMETVINGRQVKNIKLMLLRTDVIDSTVDLLIQKQHQLTFSITIGAALLPFWPEVTNATGQPTMVKSKHFVDAEHFLDNIQIRFPSAILSVGWTTPLNQSESMTASSYEWENVRDMALLLRCRKVTNELTFDIASSYLSHSISKIRWLVESFPNSSVNIWSTLTNDPDFNATATLSLLKELGNIRISFDFPPIQTQSLVSRYPKVCATDAPCETTFDNSNWMVFPKTDIFSTTTSCFVDPYVTSRTILVNGGETRIILVTRTYLMPATLTGNLYLLPSVLKPQYGMVLDSLSGQFTVFAIPTTKLPGDISRIDTDTLMELIKPSAKASYDISNHHVEDGCPISLSMSIGQLMAISMVSCSGFNATSHIVNDTKTYIDGKHLVFGFVYSGWRGFVFDNVTMEDAVVSLATRTQAVSLVLLFIRGVNNL